MFEIWQSASEPGLYLVLRKSPSFPGAFAAQDWAELGMGDVTDAVALVIARDGHATLRSPVPFEPDGIFGPALDDNAILTS